MASMVLGRIIVGAISPSEEAWRRGSEAGLEIRGPMRHWGPGGPACILRTRGSQSQSSINSEIEIGISSTATETPFSLMPFETVTFPSYAEHPVFVAYYEDVPGTTLATVKSELIARNETYNYCFLSTTHIVSWEQLRCALHRAVQNMAGGTMKANSINTEIIFSLSPVNNMNDALKRFGVDEARSDVIVVRVCDGETDLAALESSIAGLLGVESRALTDETFVQRHDAKKFKKLFKLSDAKDSSPQALTRGAVAASLLRGL